MIYFRYSSPDLLDDVGVVGVVLGEHLVAVEGPGLGPGSRPRPGSRGHAPVPLENAHHGQHRYMSHVSHTWGEVVLRICHSKSPELVLIHF